MRQFQRYVTVEPLKHGGARKQDRIAWALQGRAERDRIKLRRGSWNDYFIQQCADFPDQLAHDDALDAVAYVDQMCRSVYNDGSDQYDEWQPLDLEAGF
jgi:phage terminase large subunit-like protein